MNEEIVVKIQLKILYDKLMILNNEILNLLSISFFFNKKNIINEKKEDSKKFIKNYFENLEEDKIEIRKKRISDDINNKRYVIYNINEIKNLKINALLDCLKNKKSSELNNVIVELTYLYLRTFYFYSYIEYLYENLKEYLFKFTYTEWLIQFSFYNNELKSILDSLNIIAKSLKFRKENAYQSYVPIPLFHRRYRIYNSQLILDKYIKEKLSDFITKNKFLFDKNKIKKFKVEFIITSDYDIGDYIENTVYSNITLVKGSFFWRELYKFQPIIIHEISHKLLRLLNNKILRDLKNIINEILITYKTIFRTKTFERSFFENFKDDILCDFIGYLIFGDSYLLSLIFHGLLGYKYFETLSTHNIDKHNNQKFIFYFFNSAVNFNNFREKAIIRIFLLIRLRSEIINLIEDKKKKKDLEYLLLRINEKDNKEDLFYYINKFILDLFPITIFIDLKNNTFQKTKRDNFFYTFSHLFYHNQTTLLLISKMINKIVNIFKHYFNENIIKNLKKIEHRYRNNYFQNNLKIIDYKNIKNFKNPLIVNYNFTEPDKINKVSLGHDNNIKKHYGDSNIFNLLWKIFILNIIENKNEINKNIPDGRIFRALSILNLHNFFYELKKELKINSIELELDDLIFLKTRFIYENKEIFKGKCVNVSLFCNYLKLKRIFNIPDIYISSGPYESVFLYSEIDKYKSTKTDEFKFYKKIIQCYGYLDRHSILKLYIQPDDEKINNTSFWRTFILIKLDEKNIKENSNFSGLTNIIKRNKKDIKFIAFSLGWEDIVICAEGNLANIFNIKKEINSIESGIIKRTETIITFSCEQLLKNFHNNNKEIENIEEKDNKKIFSLILYWRVNEITSKFSIVNIEKYGFYEFLIPGRYDKAFISNRLFNEKEIKKILKIIFGTKNENIKDLSINIIMKDIKKDN